MKTIKELVTAESGEQEIQAFIKTNCLNILGEACTPSSITGEYIAFSQFQIMEGKTDFVVFTNRSRMVVVIIEIKGADFNFLNTDGTINKNIHDAAQQVRNRFSHIQNNYETCRRRFHEIRRDVEAGETIYSSLLGPAKYLEVDPEKEIWWKGMVVGGRSTNDHKESKIRNQLESESPRITYDTWDGWLKNNGHYSYTMRTNYPTGAN